MRLSEKEICSIKQNVAKYFGEGTKLVLFGSRISDEKRGGDIDLLIEPLADAGDLYYKKLQFTAAVKQEIGDQKLDIILKRKENEDRVIVVQAMKTGIVL